ncbi:hypothetical protein [Paenibacillus sp. D9]|uniref:hypothetical protein n=1 Tax=Paenibacillus sp. D9 TaxID=665792 RepID=UPI001E5B611C|nr:hypothetical protein [Paenibacillus sp. D9]
MTLLSRSWERKVRRNSAQINATRKKRGQTAIKPAASGDRTERFKGRNFISPIMLVLFVALYVLILPKDEGATNWNWIVVAMYVFLALMFFLRRPYLAVGADFVQTRRMTGDKRLNKEAIKGISVMKSYVVIEQVKGANWVFSRVLNRYPTDRMAVSLEQFAARNGIPFTQK